MSKSMGAGPKVVGNQEDLAVIQQGAKAWNDWRKDKDVSSLNLSGVDLHGRDLTGADLRAVDLSNANLRSAKLGKGTLLWNANLSNADLYQVNLRGADLQDVNFSGADLYQAALRESNLQGADLSTAKGGLLSRQLAGSDLTGAKLPEPLAKLYDSLSSVKEISDSAQKLFLALLAGCLYSWLTIAQTTDVELITNRATTPLPIIQAAIPIVGFYVVAPLILLCLYFYFHFYLQKLWEELGSLPAVFTDGRELHKRTDP
ncbi:MAG TPA: pentapeptide repeat-containing protein, partial [Candidatus Acidoferrum sp.]|nr:pentapeptide repeat-containing protein [Candidatus Acidoferrum sp.]